MGKTPPFPQYRRISFSHCFSALRLTKFVTWPIAPELHAHVWTRFTFTVRRFAVSNVAQQTKVSRTDLRSSISALLGKQVPGSGLASDVDNHLV